MTSLFFKLLRVSLGNQTSLSHNPTDSEWHELYELAKKQSLLGICFMGVQKAVKQGAQIDKVFYVMWAGAAAKICKRNERINEQCITLQHKMREAGLETCILKGQGVGLLYKIPNVQDGKGGEADLSQYRQPGDIDVWANAGWEGVMNYVNALTPNREFDIKHTHLNVYEDTVVEVHWWPSSPTNPLVRKRIYKYYTQQAPLQCENCIKLSTGQGEITSPDAKFQTIHVLGHIFSHFLYEGVGLRQIMDLYFVLTNGGLTEEDRREVWRYTVDFGYSRLAPAVMWLLVEVMGMNPEKCICQPNKKQGLDMLEEVMEGGNFGHHGKKNNVSNESWTHRMIRRMKRKARLYKYNPVGVICSPITKLQILAWKTMVRKKYNL